MNNVPFHEKVGLVFGPVPFDISGGDQRIMKTALNLDRSNEEIVAPKAVQGAMTPKNRGTCRAEHVDKAMRVLHATAFALDPA